MALAMLTGSHKSQWRNFLRSYKKAWPIVNGSMAVPISPPFFIPEKIYIPAFCCNLRNFLKRIAVLHLRLPVAVYYLM
jgi:ABC-type uncharacterized transport system fused permease/ATPase subunit